MTKAVAKTKTTAVAIPEEIQGWNKTHTDARDITLPKLMLVQPLSPQAQEDGIDAGDIIVNSDNNVVAKKDGAVSFIPLFCIKKWRIEAKPIGTTKFKWESTELYTMANADANYTWDDNGVEYRRVMVHEWACLRVEDIAKDIKAREAIARGEMPDLDDALLPTVISFRRSSMPASKEIHKFGAKAESFQVPIFIQTFDLGVHFSSEGEHQYYTMTVKKGRQATKEEIAICKSWFDILFTEGFKVDESDEETSSTVREEATTKAANPVGARQHSDEVGALTDQDIPF